MLCPVLSIAECIGNKSHMIQEIRRGLFVDGCGLSIFHAPQITILKPKSDMFVRSCHCNTSIRIFSKQNNHRIWEEKLIVYQHLEYKSKTFMFLQITWNLLFSSCFTKNRLSFKTKTYTTKLGFRPPMGSEQSGCCSQVVFNCRVMYPESMYLRT